MIRRSYHLDVLRGIAIVLVLFRHIPAIAVAPNHFGLMQPLVDVGWAGVDLFFVLSGFLVSGLLFKEMRDTGRVRIKNFLLRRGFKIYPSFYLFLAATLFVTITLKQFTWVQALSEAVLIQGYLPAFWNHTWSLAVEEHFYLSLAIVVGLFSTAFPRRFPSICWFTMVTCLVLRIVGKLHFDISNENLMYLSVFRMDSLSFGALLSYYYHYHPDVFSSWVVKVKKACIPIVCLSALNLWLVRSEDGWYTRTLGVTFLYLSAGAVVMVAAKAATPARVSFFGRSLATIGFYSYTTYLWHMAVIHWGINGFSKHVTQVNYPVSLGLYFVLSVAVGIVLGKWVEQPILALRDRLVPRVDSPGVVDSSKMLNYK